MTSLPCRRRQPSVTLKTTAAQISVMPVLISHRMPDIFAVCDRVVVLRRGEKVADKHISQTSQDEVTGLITGAVERA